MRTALGLIVACLLAMPSASAGMDPCEAFFSFWSDGALTQEFRTGIGVLVEREDALDCRASVRVTTQDGTAVAGEAYEAVDEEVVLENGPARVYVDIPLVDDVEAEPDSALTARLSPMGASRLGAVPVIEVEIIDDDWVPDLPRADPGDADCVPELGFPGLGGGGIGETWPAVAVRVLREDEGRCDVTVTLSTEARPGTAVAGEDYRATEVTLEFPRDAERNERGQVERRIEVALIDDPLEEGDEVFYIAFTDASVPSSFWHTLNRVTIVANDVGAASDPPPTPVPTADTTADPDPERPTVAAGLPLVVIALFVARRVR